MSSILHYIPNKATKTACGAAGFGTAMPHRVTCAKCQSKTPVRIKPMVEWHINDELGNHVLMRDDYHISFNPQVNETAIFDGNSFYILKGDHRDGYTRLKSLNNCFSYFLANYDLRAESSALLDDDPLT